MKCCILRDSEYLKGIGIVISEDFSERVRREREYLKRHMFEARRQGCHAVLQYDKLIINGRVWHRGELEDMDNHSQEKEEVSGVEPEVAENEARAMASPDKGSRPPGKMGLQLPVQKPGQERGECGFVTSHCEGQRAEDSGDGTTE